MNFRFPKSLFVDAGNVGLVFNVPGEGGPQGNPMGSAQPTPWPFLSKGSTYNVFDVSFGVPIVPPPYGAANWNAAVPSVNNSGPNAGRDLLAILGLIKKSGPVTDF